MSSTSRWSSNNGCSNWNIGKIFKGTVTKMPTAKQADIALRK